MSAFGLVEPRFLESGSIAARMVLFFRIGFWRGYGVATACIGGGQGIAMIVETLLNF